ncbi:hypothetical protein B1813_04455 [Saccharomonospora piscinae]|uniref:Excreted virulence factor EspC, type VII ESX diderm n=1 Tax=Saccharomonospora piscinae TaxID=687388 RepID=A0A1V9A9I5_SACPI|nr:type VII secretion target [Saccharomonospora piscinae]OQO93785.1 hypothetical protein B1813_04455 [Saccharomonospora piscinae]
MGFRAEPGSIREFGEAMDGLVSDANAAKDYVSDHLNVTAGDARMFATVAGAAADVLEALTANYGRLATIQRTSAAEVDKAAVMYQETDDEKAERLDRTYETGD